MDYLLDYQLRLNTDSKYKSLYSWSIDEVDVNGKVAGKANQIPWVWSVYFDVFEVSYNPEIDIREYQDEPVKAMFRERVRAKLRPQNDDSLFGGTTFSMFGTKRNIEDFALFIVPSDDDAESVEASGVISWEADDGLRKDLSPDFLEFFLKLKKSTFDHLVGLITRRSLTSAYLRLSNVDGFYSDWSPDIITDHIKVLTADHKCEMPDSCEIDAPIVREVGEFSLSLQSSQKLEVSS